MECCKTGCETGYGDNVTLVHVLAVAICSKHRIAFDRELAMTDLWRRAVESRHNAVLAQAAVVGGTMTYTEAQAIARIDEAVDEEVRVWVQNWLATPDAATETVRKEVGHA